MTRSNNLLLSVIVLVSICSLALAEEGDRGRLPDGRAFRTDSQGTQLVDYIAELELNIDALNRRVVGLEDELQEKESAISKLNQGLPTQGELTERDIAGGSESTKLKVSEPRSFKATNDCPRVDCTACSNSDDQSFARAYEREIDELRGVLARTETELQSKRNDLELVKTKAGSEINKYLEDREEIDSQLNDLRLSYDQAKQQHTKETKDLQEKLSDAQEELVRAQEEANTLRVRYAALEKQKEDLKESSASTVSVRTELIDPRASYRSTELSRRAAHPFSEPSQEISPARLRAVQSIRGNLMTELNSVRGLLGARSEAYNSYAKGGRAVNFKLNRAVSSRNLSLEDISRGAQRADSVYELSLLKRDLTEIRNKVQDDLSLVKRMNKVNG